MIPRTPLATWRTAPQLDVQWDDYEQSRRIPQTSRRQPRDRRRSGSAVRGEKRSEDLGPDGMTKTRYGTRPISFSSAASEHVHAHITLVDWPLVSSSLAWLRGRHVGTSLHPSTRLLGARRHCRACGSLDDGTLLLVNLIAIPLLFLAAGVALGTVTLWGRIIPRWVLLPAVWGVSLILSVRGIGGLVQRGLSGGHSGSQSLLSLIADPWFVLGGVLFGMAAATYTRKSCARENRRT